MKFAIAKEHRDFFSKNQRIEFDSLLPPVQCDAFVKTLASVLTDRRNVSKREPLSFSSDQPYLSGRDIWRGSAVLKKIILTPQLAGIASDILQLKPLRIAYDQLIPPSSLPSSLTDAPKTLLGISCIQGIVGGLMLCLGEPHPTPATDATCSTVPSIFPSKPGNGVFFSPDCPIDFSARTEGCTYIMIVYAKKSSVYYREEGDPHVHALKSLGYNFGDVLSDRLHPIVFS